MLKFGATTLPLAGWIVDPRQADAARAQRLQAIRRLVEDYHLRAVELTLDLALLFPQSFDASFYARIAELQSQLGFTCTVHLPFIWVDISSLNEPIRQASVASMQHVFNLTRVLDVASYVIHPWGATTAQVAAVLDHPTQRQALMAVLMGQVDRSLAALCQAVDPARLCIETLESPAFDFALPLVEKYQTGICLDIGHLAWHNGDPVEFLRRHAGRVREIHLHDARKESMGSRPHIVDHLPLGKGQVAYPAFLAELEGMGFTGAVILENNSLPDLEESLSRLQGYL